MAILLDKKLLLLLPLLFMFLVLPQKAHAAIRFGGVTSQPFHCNDINCTDDNVTPFAAPVITGSNTVLLIAVSVNAASEEVPSSVTYNGVTLGAPTFDSGRVNFTRTVVWVVMNPASAKNVVVKVANVTNNGVVIAAYYTGVKQVTPYRTATIGTGLSNPATLSVTNSQAGDLIAGFFSLDDTAAVDGLTLGRVGAGQTFRLTTVNSTHESQLALSEEAGASGAVTHSWDFVNDGGNGWAGVAIPLIPATGTLSKPPNNLGLVGYWSFNEGTGTKANDSSGNRNIGTLVGSPTWTSGKLGQALNFDGAASKVDVGSGASIDNLGAITISAWIKPNAQNGEIYDKVSDGGGNATGPDFWIQANGPFTRLFFARQFAGGTNSWNVDDAIIVGQWQHVVVAFDGNPADAPDFYVNGVLLSPTNGGGFIGARVDDSAEEAVIGAYGALTGTNSFFNGQIDEVRVYNRELGASEVASLYQSGAAKVSNSAGLTTGTSLGNSSLVGHWTFDGPDTISTITDRSGRNNNGYFIGGATSSAKVAGKLGQALNFASSTSAIAYNFIEADGAASAIATGDVTFTAWIKLPVTYTSNSNPMRILHLGDPSSSNDIALSLGTTDLDTGPVHTGQLTFAFLSNLNNPAWRSASAAQTTWAPNTWYFVVGTLSGGTVTTYLNGVQDGVNVTGSTRNTSAAATHFGIGGEENNGNPFEPFNGTIDDARVYNRALTPAEVKQLYGIGKIILKR